MKNIFLVCHCSAAGQHIDSPLTYNGMNQAQQLDSFFTNQDLKFDRIMTSPYLRAIDSIKLFADRTNTEIIIHDNLKERIVSNEPVADWIDVVEKSFRDFNFCLPGGESAAAALERANIVLDSLLSDDSIENAIMVSHGNLISLLLTQYDSTFGFDQWKRLRNPDVYLLHVDQTNESISCVWQDA